MHVLILNWRDPENPKAGGAEYVTMEHAKAWVRAGHRVTWFTSLYSGATHHETRDGIEIARHGNEHTVHILAPFFYLFGGKFDIVIDEIHGIPFFTPLYVRGPKIAFIHEVAMEIWDFMFPIPMNYFGKLIERFAFFSYRTTSFWTDAPSTVEELIAMGIPKNQCIAIACPITNKPVSRIPIKKDPIFLSVNRMVPMKRIEDTIRAFARIKKGLKRAKLWVVGFGDKDYIHSLHALVYHLGIESSVRFFGWVSEEKKITLMRHAYLLFHTSIKEGWGLAVLEAGSQGTPAVVYNVAGLRDVVISGKSGVVLQENSPHALAKAALDLYKNKKFYRKLQIGAKIYAASFHWDDVTKESIRLLESVAKKV